MEKIGGNLKKLWSLDQFSSSGGISMRCSPRRASNLLNKCKLAVFRVQIVGSKPPLSLAIADDLLFVDYMLSCGFIFS